VAATIAAALALGAASVPAAANVTHPTVPAWEQALVLRGRALDRAHGLGSFRPLGPGLHLSTTELHSAWLRALELRSVGLDRIHHLGSFAPPPVM
jgi:hypothetical protein